MFNASAVNEVLGQLKPLTFDIEKDSTCIKQPAIKAYLNHYQINFSETLNNVRHGFGTIDVNGYFIATHYWLPDIARGTIFVFHGYYDHVGLFNHIIRFSLQNEYAVVAYDLPGMGLSSGPRASIDSFSVYHDVLESCVNRFRNVMPMPWFAVAQSAGSVAVISHILQAKTIAFEKSIFLAPLVRSKGWERDRILYAIGRWFIRSLPRVFTDNSHDEAFLKFLKKSDPMQHRRLVIKWVGAMKQWIQQVENSTPVDYPVLIIQGDDDHTVDSEYNLPALQRILPQAKIKMVTRGRHHLVAESAPYRAQVFAGIKSFVEKPYVVENTD